MLGRQLPMITGAVQVTQ